VPRQGFAAADHALRCAEACVSLSRHAASPSPRASRTSFAGAVRALRGRLRVALAPRGFSGVHALRGLRAPALSGGAARAPAGRSRATRLPRSPRASRTSFASAIRGAARAPAGRSRATRLLGAWRFAGPSLRFARRRSRVP